MMAEGARPSRRVDVAIVLVAAAACLLPGMGAGLPAQTAEARVPVAARTMAREGLTLIPTLGERPWLHKPPLAVWLQALSMRVFGETLAAAAVPAAVLATALVVAVTLRAGPLAGLILLLSPRFLLSARGYEMDIIFASFTGLAILCGLDEVRARGRVGPFSPLLLGLAVLTKGPLCLVFALLALGRGFISPFAPLALAPAAAWWGTASARSPGLTDKIVSQLARGGSGEATTHVGPFHEYAAALFPLAFPAIVPLALAGIACVVARRRIVDVGREVLADDERKRLLRWFAGGLLFLSALAIKQSSYALPIYAPLALLGAAAAERAVPARALRAGAVGLAGAIAVAALVCGHLAGVRLLEPALGAAAAGAGLVLAIRAGSGVAAYRRALLAGIPALLLGILPLIHKNQRDRSLVPVGERIRAEIGRGRAIGLLETSGPHAEPIAWGAGEDLPVFDTVEAARARGVTCAVREIKEGRAGEGGDLPVLLDLPHPRHHNRRLQVVDLTVPPR